MFHAAVGVLLGTHLAQPETEYSLDSANYDGKQAVGYTYDNYG